MSAYILILTVFSVYGVAVSPVPFASNSLCEKAGAEFVKQHDRLASKAYYLCVEAK